MQFIFWTGPFTYFCTCVSPFLPSKSLTHLKLLCSICSSSILATQPHKAHAFRVLMRLPAEKLCASKHFNRAVFTVQSAGKFPHQPSYLPQQPFSLNCQCPTGVLPFSVTVRYGRATHQNHVICGRNAEKNLWEKSSLWLDTRKGDRSEACNIKIDGHQYICNA